MKKSKLIICGALASLLAQPICAGEVKILRENYLNSNPACPNTEVGYWVNEKNEYGKYKWNITGGYFIYMGEKKTEIFEYNRSRVSVKWNKVKSMHGEAPKGTITLKVYSKYNPDRIIDEDKKEQEIKCLDGIIPANLETKKTDLSYERHTIKVFGEPLYYPGVKYYNGMLYPVNRYEWKVPNGWLVKGAKKTESGTFISNSYVVDIVTDDKNSGDVMVRGISSDCIFSDDYSEYSWPLKFTRYGLGIVDYPAKIIAGKINTFSVKVTPIKGAEYEWQAPAGWSINNGSNIFKGSQDSISVKTGICMTSEKIKVRYKDAKGTYSNWRVIPSKMVSPSIIIPSEIEQYIPASFSLDIPDENVKSVTWYINSDTKHIYDVYNKSAIQTSFYEAGDVSLSAELILKGCSDTIQIPTAYINVQKSPIVISSPIRRVCNNPVTFSLKGLPPNVPMGWFTSPDLEIISQEGYSITVKRNSSMKTMYEECFVAADIGEPYNCTVVQEGIIVWNSGIFRTNDLIEVSRIKKEFVSDRYEYTAKPKGDWLYWLPMGPTWKAHGNNINVLMNDGTYIVFEGPSEVWIEVNLVNQCGESMKIVHDLSDNGNNNGPFYFSLTPNPATNTVGVNIEEINMTRSLQKTMKSPSYQIQLWSSYGLIKQVSTDQKNYQLDLSNLSAGLYYVHVVKDGKRYSQRLIVK